MCVCKGLFWPLLEESGVGRLVDAVRLWHRIASLWAPTGRAFALPAQVLGTVKPASTMVEVSCSARCAGGAYASLRMCVCVYVWWACGAVSRAARSLHSLAGATPELLGPQPHLTPLTFTHLRARAHTHSHTHAHTHTLPCRVLQVSRLVHDDILVLIEADAVVGDF